MKNRLNVILILNTSFRGVLQKGVGSGTEELEFLNLILGISSHILVVFEEKMKGNVFGEFDCVVDAKTN